METTKKLQRVGGSVALTIPAEIARELSLKPEDEVRVRSEGGRMVVESVAAGPDADVAKFVARFTDRYDEALRNLAKR